MLRAASHSFILADIYLRSSISLFIGPTSLPYFLTKYLPVLEMVIAVSLLR